MSDTQHVAEAYIAIWNDQNPATRRAQVEALFTEDATFVDPLADIQGWDAIDQLITGAQSQFTGLTFSLAGNADGHHNIARFTWHLSAPGTEDPIVIGFDVIALDDTNRITQIHGFLDKVPA
ncbi:MAG: hypothetical protein QOI21_5480 [Actinomycetota bacterium]|jgi:ketosteroid isomerase-like protein|nr:hypothetical protein [Actinomycetota bacterium]